MFKKIFNLDSINSIMLETMLLSIIGIGYLIIIGFNGEGHFLVYSGHTDVLLIVSGLVTMLPLYLFSEGARRIPLASVGFLQYFAPSLMLIIGVLIYGEALTRTYLISFILIWTGLAIYTYNLFRTGYKNRKNRKLRVASE
jgi:chloramphenicol-sensitive protein RarD